MTAKFGTLPPCYEYISHEPRREPRAEYVMSRDELDTTLAHHVPPAMFRLSPVSRILMLNKQTRHKHWVTGVVLTTTFGSARFEIPIPFEEVDL